MLDHNNQRPTSLPRRLVAFIGVIVPRRFRARFRKEWEADDVAEREQRSPRRYYELTKDGRAALAEALKRYRALENFFVGAKKPKPSDA